MSNENLISALEKTTAAPTERAPTFSAACQVGGAEWTAITGKYVKPIDDGFSIDFGDCGKVAHMSETPAKGKQVRFDSPEWRAEHAQVGMENMGGTAKHGMTYGDELDHNSQAYRDRARKVVADTEAKPRTTGSEQSDYIRDLMKR